MADNEVQRRPHFPRKNPNLRPPPGVQKAMHNFGVKDLREILDKKHNEGETQEEKKIDPKKLPPPDPSYNYLRDPARDTQPLPKKDEKKMINKHNSKNNEQNKEQDNKNKDDSSKKEVHFNEEGTFKGRGSFRGHGPRRQGGKMKEQEKIENAFNIKIELNTETDTRSCVLDENVKIADIKHVPDHPPHKPRGSYRGCRNSFRGRGRGRGGFKNRGGHNNTATKENSEQDRDEWAESSEVNNEETKLEEESRKSDFDSKMAETITITSSRLQDGERFRSIKVEDNEESEVENNKN